MPSKSRKCHIPSFLPRLLHQRDPHERRTPDQVLSCFPVYSSSENAEDFARVQPMIHHPFAELKRRSTAFPKDLSTTQRQLLALLIGHYDQLIQREHVKSIIGMPPHLAEVFPPLPATRPTSYIMVLPKTLVRGRHSCSLP
jgi:hypothetical protein